MSKKIPGLREDWETLAELDAEAFIEGDSKLTSDQEAAKLEFRKTSQYWEGWIRFQKTEGLMRTKARVKYRQTMRELLSQPIVGDLSEAKRSARLADDQQLQIDIASIFEGLSLRLFSTLGQNNVTLWPEIVEAAKNAQISRMQDHCKKWKLDLDIVKSQFWGSSLATSSPQQSTPPKARMQSKPQSPKGEQDKPLRENPIKIIDGKTIVDWD